jgi:hypothetical protein
MIIPLDAEQQYPSIIKPLSKSVIEENFFNLIKGIYENT